MYSMGIVLHFYSVALLVVVISANIYALKNAREIVAYKRSSQLLFVPLLGSLIFAIMFTGTVLMAAKHLEFTIENIVMIVIGGIVVVLEIKRIKPLKYIRGSDTEGFAGYKRYALNIFYVEAALVVAVGAWMLL